MKASLLMIIVIFTVALFASCTKEEELLSVLPEQPVEAKVILPQALDTLAYKIQALYFKVPTKSEILAAPRPHSDFNLKSGPINDKSLSVRIIVADSSSFFIYTNELNETIFVRPVVYYELLSGGRKEYLTADQEYPIINGKINPDVYSVKCEFACPYARYYQFRNSNYITNVNYLFTFDDKTIAPISYFGNGFNGTVRLAPLPGGHWELLVTKDDGDFRKEYSTGPINYFGSNILDLQYEIKPENTVSTVKVPAGLLLEAKTINLIGYDPETGRELIVSYVISYNNNSNQNYDAPFDISYVVICKENQGCWWYETKIVGISNGNISLYEVKQAAG